MLQDNLTINESGNLVFGGANTVEMAGKYGTPLYLMDENRLRENCRRYIRAMKENYVEGSMPLYASKALSVKEIYRIVASEGLGADVVSIGELHTALLAGFPPEKLYFHGNVKKYEEIAFAMDRGIGCIVADNETELCDIERAAGERGITQRILIRLAPGIDPHTFEKIKTGSVDSKFGAAIATGQALEITKKALSLKNVRLEGFHCHIGSQIFECKPFCDTADIMLSFMVEVREKFGFTAPVLNLGGGFGARYLNTDPVIDYEKNIADVASHVKARCTEHNFPQPVVYMEPGRGIVGDAGITLYTVQSVKCIPGHKNYVSVDGGMTDNPRYTLYGAPYSMVIANRAGEPHDFEATLAGRCCESGDILGEGFMMKKPEVGDTLAVLATGAYNYSMSMNYNRVPRAPIVMVKDGKDRVVVRRETLDDLVACDL